jgi:hypothetical protein
MEISNKELILWLLKCIYTLTIHILALIGLFSIYITKGSFWGR